MQRWAASRWKLPVLSGLSLGVGYYVPVLVPLLLAFVPILYWIDRHAEAGRYARFRGMLLFGGVAGLIGLHFCYAMLDFSWLAAVLWIAFAALLALRMALVLLLASWLRRATGLGWGLVLPLCWVPPEWLQTFGDLRMTGDHAAHAMAAYPFLIQFADLVGHYGVSAFVLVVNGSIYDAWLGPARQARRRAAATLGALLVVVLTYDAWCWWRPLPSRGSVRVALVQPNIALSIKHGRGTAAEQSERLARLSREAASEHPALIVWPESARPDPVFHWLDKPETYAMPDISALARETGAAFLVGAEYYRVRSRDDYELYNAALAVSPQGEMTPEWAAKVYLVPFVEATPFRRFLGPLVEGRGGEWEWLAGGFEPGPRGQVISLDGGHAGVLVCYEQLFPDLARALRNAGADYEVVITNDAWFGRTPFQYFLANAPRLRAIENRTELVRVANTGISGFVDRRGRYHDRTRLFTEAVAVRDVELAGERTFYARTGDWIVGVLFAGLTALALAARGATRHVSAT